MSDVRPVPGKSFEHRLATFAACATFVLLVIGGTVNPTGSSLACPEPTLVCHGQLFPPMEGGVFYEHGHRLAAMTVGLVQIALSILLIVRRKKLVLPLVLFGMVCAQGTLGALTVAFKLPWFVSTSHLLLAMSYFATLIYTAFATRPQPTEAELATRAQRLEVLGPARRWIAIACGAVFVQLLVGALVRHLGAAMVCLGMPTCTISGEWWPDAAVQQLHMIHRAVGVLVALVTITAAVQVFPRTKYWPRLRLLVTIAPVLVLAQIGLGIATVLTLRAVPLAVAHFAGAASLWALWMSSYLMTAPRRARAIADTRPAVPSAVVQTSGARRLVSTAARYEAPE